MAVTIASAASGGKDVARLSLAAPLVPKYVPRQHNIARECLLEYVAVKKRTIERGNHE